MKTILIFRNSLFYFKIFILSLTLIACCQFLWVKPLFSLKFLINVPSRFCIFKVYKLISIHL
jgi:hypothetical protein